MKRFPTTCALIAVALTASFASADPVPAVLPESHSVQTIAPPKGVPFCIKDIKREADDFRVFSTKPIAHLTTRTS